MHALLSLSAAQLMQICPSQRHLYRKSATIHRQLALNLSLPFLQDISPTNCHAVFALSCIVAVLAFCLPQSSVNSDAADSVSDILDFIPLIRGVRTVLENAEWIRQGSTSPIVRDGTDRLTAKGATHTTPPLHKELEIAIENLIQINKTTTINTKLRDIYGCAIQELREAFEIINIITEERTLAFIWPMIVSEAYLAALMKREPMALVILAHYGVLLHSINGQWWSKGRGSQLVNAIYQALAPDWQAAVQWPRVATRKKCEFPTEQY